MQARLWWSLRCISSDSTVSGTTALAYTVSCTRVMGSRKDSNLDDGCVYLSLDHPSFHLEVCLPGTITKGCFVDTLPSILPSILGRIHVGVWMLSTFHRTPFYEIQVGLCDQFDFTDTIHYTLNRMMARTWNPPASAACSYATCTCTFNRHRFYV
jgi:hypothetical protein